MNPKRSRIAIVGLIVALAGLIAWSATVLPAHVASHFDFAGRPNGWMSREGFLALMAGLALLLVALPAGVGWLVRTLPADFVNLPNRGYWLAPERKPEAARRIRSAMEWFAALQLALALGITILAVRANLPGGAFDSRVAGVLLAVFLGGLGAWMVTLVRAFRVPGNGLPGAGGRATRG